MKIIAFIDEGDAIKEILSHLGEPADPPRIAPATARRCGKLPVRAATIF